MTEKGENKNKASLWRASFYLAVEHKDVLCVCVKLWGPWKQPEPDSGQNQTLNDDSNEWGYNDLVCCGWFPYRL